LLRGLDVWLQLGLISDLDVKRLARSQLICDYREVPVTQPVQRSPLQTASETEAVVIQDTFADERPDRTAPASRPPIPRPEIPRPAPPRSPQPIPTRSPQSVPPRTPSPSFVGQLLGSFLEEISILWLLFLGVFLVVGSSAVLAALAWKNVPPVGQYGILWSYTLGFGLAAWLTGRNEKLRLTSRMLQVATLLIIPVNFWMMDGFQLWRSPLGWIMVAIASVSLFFLQFQLLRSSSRLNQVNHLALSLLHWGWMMPGLAFVATYVGTVGTVALQLLGDRTANSGVSTTDPAPANAPSNRLRLALDAGQIAIAFATLLLISRATLAQGIALSALGLAVGISGWLLCWQNRSQAQPFWTPIGGSLIGLAWLLTVTDRQLWQALGISGLALHLLWHRLHRHWDKITTVSLILVGLQTYSLLRVFLPPAVRASAIAWMAERAQLQLGNWELTGLGFFLSLIGILLFGSYLQRHNQPQLATIANVTALGWGIALALPGLFNPLVRSIYFLGWTLLLGIGVGRRRSVPDGLIYLTHVSGLITLICWLNWGFPTWRFFSWAIVLLGLATVEWILCLLPVRRVWGKSAWFLGLGLSSLGYLILCIALLEDWTNPMVALIGLAIPGMLTLLSRSPSFSRIASPQLAATLAIPATILATVPTVMGINPFLIATAVGTVLMGFNTQRLRHLIPALLTVSLGMAAVTTLGWRVWNPIPQNWILPWIAGLIVLLWCFWAGLRSLTPETAKPRSTQHTSSPEAAPATNRAESAPLSRLFANATDIWAIGLTSMSFLLITGLVTYEFFVPGTPPWQTLLAVGLTTGAIALRTGVQRTGFGWLGLAWGVELLIAYVAEIWNLPLEFRIITNLVLGVLTQIGTDFWERSAAQRRQRQDDSALPISAILIPLFYGLFGVFLGHFDWTKWTGLYAIAGMLPFLGIGRRSHQLKPLTYLGLIGVSLGAYELLIYQLQQLPPNDNFGDAIVLFAGLTMAILLAYRLLERLLGRCLHLQPREVGSVAQVHWGVATLLLVLGLLFPISVTGSYLWAGIAALLGFYALSEGRSRSDSAQTGWIYPGVVQIWAAIGMLCHQFLPGLLLAEWGGAIAALVAFGTDSLPWSRLGWQAKPFRNASAILPLGVILVTAGTVNVQSLLIAGAFYAWLARLNRQIRLSYLGLGLAGWAGFRLLHELGLRDPLWYVAVLSGAILFMVQIDPSLRSESQRETRHWLRCLATGLFCLTALYQSELSIAGSLTPWVQGLITIAFSLGLVIAGLMLRTRAFLYIGTLTFMLKVLRQLWVFIADYSIALWALGIALGLVLIWIAATFEARRSQAIALVQYWIAELEAWE
jgi:hypothetical protein